MVASWFSRHGVKSPRLKLGTVSETGEVVRSIFTPLSASFAISDKMHLRFSDSRSAARVSSPTALIKHPA